MMRSDLINNRFFIMFRFQMNSSAARSYCWSCTRSYRALYFTQVPQLQSQPLYWYVTYPEILRYRTCKLRIGIFHAVLLAQNKPMIRIRSQHATAFSSSTSCSPNHGTCTLCIRRYYVLLSTHFTYGCTSCGSSHSFILMVRIGYVPEALMPCSSSNYVQQ